MKRKIFSEKKILRTDIILCVLLLLSIAAVWGLNHNYGSIINMDEEISYVYSVQEASDGSLYILDSSHERLLHLDDNGDVLDVIFPSDEDGIPLFTDGFSVSPDGRVYVNASEWSGMLIGREMIIKYDADGKRLGEEAYYDYSDNPTTKHHIHGVRATDKGVDYCYLNDNSIWGYSIEDGQKAEKKYELPYANAFNAAAQIEFHEDKVYILDKAGKIMQYSWDTGKEGKSLYDVRDDIDQTIVPYGMHVSEGEGIYFNDIKNQTIRFLPEGLKTSETLIEGTDSNTVYVTESAQADTRIYLAEADGVRVFDGDTEYVYNQVSKTFQMQILYWLYRTLWVFSVIILILILIRLAFVLSGVRLSRKQFQILGIVGLVGLVSFALLSLLLNEFFKQYTLQLDDRLENTACIIANQINADDLEAITTADKFDSDEYRNLCEIMENSCPQDMDFFENLYCNILRLDEDGNAYAIAYLDQTIGTYYPLDEEETKEVKTVYETGESTWNGGKEDISGTYLYVKVPIYSQNNVTGAVAVGITLDSLQSIMGQLRRSIYSVMVAALILVALLINEGISFTSLLDGYKAGSNIHRRAFPSHLLRIMVFLIFTAYNMSVSFLPVYIINHMENTGPIPRELAASLPITVNIFMIGLMSVFCASLVRRFGMKILVVVSGLCSLAGNLMMFIWPDYRMIFLALILDGIGVGIMSNTSYILITYIREEKQRMEGFSIYNAACLSGINFGMLLGSVLAANFGQKIVFLCIAIFWLVVIFASYNASDMIDGFLDNSSGKGDKATNEIGPGGLLKDFKVTGFLVFIQNPFIIFNSFIFYFVPIYCDQIGENETMVALLLIFYSGLAILFGDYLTKEADRRWNKNAMYIALFLNAGAVLLYGWLPTMKGLMLALLILGISSAFGKPVQQTYYMSLGSVQRFGEDRAMGIYNFTENIGESLGPVIFGRMMFMTPLNIVLSVFSAVIAGCGAAYKVIQGIRGKED